MQYTRQQMLAQLGHLVFSEAPAAPEGGGEAPDPQEGQESSQETDEQEGDDESQEDESEPFDSDRALRKIQKLNSENKNLRTRAQEAEEKASGSEELTKTNEQQASEILRLRVALKHGLPEALVGRLNGSSEEELLADAEELMGLFVAKEPPSQKPKRKTAMRTPDSAEDGVNIDEMVLKQLSQ
ncbi:hypothetical protein ABZ546_13905 [Brachybacterium paraconglomeratum]